MSGRILELEQCLIRILQLQKAFTRREDKLLSYIKQKSLIHRETSLASNRIDLLRTYFTLIFFINISFFAGIL